MQRQEKAKEKPLDKTNKISYNRTDVSRHLAIQQKKFVVNQPFSVIEPTMEGKVWSFWVLTPA